MYNSIVVTYEFSIHPKHNQKQQLDINCSYAIYFMFFFFVSLCRSEMYVRIYFKYLLVAGYDLELHDKTIINSHVFPMKKSYKLS